MNEETEIVVAGGGVIGLCTALSLRMVGRTVLLVERNEPGAGASSGNAGVVANYACVPLGTPGVLKSLPKLLFDPASPLSISVSALPQLLPWLLRFARASLPGPARRAATSLTVLLQNSLTAYDPILDCADARGLLRRDGVIHLLKRKQDLDTILWDRELRTALGLRQTLLDRDAIDSLEPHLPPQYAAGILYPDAAHFTDPVELMRLLTRAFIARGGLILKDEIVSLETSSHRVQVKARNAVLQARTVIVSLGAWSALLARQIGDYIPLEAERGYHVEFPLTTPPISRPVCPLELGFYLTPMAGRLRAAGTVELSNLRRPPNPRRIQQIERGARELFPQLGPAATTWLGFRPSLPDSLPVIGRSTRTPNVVYAFGHGHLGLTLAAETARQVVNIVAGRDEQPALLAALSPRRFS